MFRRDKHDETLPRISMEKEALAPGRLDSSMKKGSGNESVSRNETSTPRRDPTLPEGISADEMTAGKRSGISLTRSPIRFPYLRGIPSRPPTKARSQPPKGNERT
jgi:hypothetical protein